MFYNLQFGHYTVQSSTRAPLWAPDISVPRVIQGHKNIFMRASGYWATEMFAIFTGLHDSIQASRLILRAPTVSPSIRNMYNSAVSFFFPLLSFSKTYTCAITSNQGIQRKGKNKKNGWSARRTEHKEGCWEMTSLFSLSQSGLLKK